MEHLNVVGAAPIDLPAFQTTAELVLILPNVRRHKVVHLFLGRRLKKPIARNASLKRCKLTRKSESASNLPNLVPRLVRSNPAAIFNPTPLQKPNVARD
jgi:hypothetical protein